jgi:crotonobetainyl-CoA:carnitine CoA-transferase CaiB-like acyl-CoA transferase
MTPLDGITVLDLSRVLAGPYCTMTLGDLGATVWKIENPAGGDETRTWLPPDVAGVSTYYLAINRNKKSIAIDLKHPDGSRLARELALRADVLVANFLPGTLERFGLDYETLSASNPGLVHCTISGYGARGSRARQAGYDFVIQGESGFMAITGEPGQEPMKHGLAVCDLLTGGNASQAILAALLARNRDGRGQAIDISLLDSALAAMSSVAAAALNTAFEPKSYGNAHPSIVPYQTFRAADGNLVLACGNDRQFRDLCERVIDRPQYVADARFATNEARVEHRDEVARAIGEVFERMTCAEILAKASAANVPAGPIRAVRDALNAPEVAERGMIASFEHASVGRVEVVGSPLHLLGTPVEMRSGPPVLGQHTREVLGGVLRLDAAALDVLESGGAIRSANANVNAGET